MGPAKGRRRLARAGKVAVVAAALLAATGVWVIGVGPVRGRSMEPALADGSWLVFEKLGVRRSGPKRFDVVVFKAPLDPATCYIKRVIGLPNEVVEVKAGVLFVDGAETPPPPGVSWGAVDLGPVAVQAAHYWVLGDNLPESVDSRSWGGVPKDYILGRVVAEIWPLGKVGLRGRRSAEVKEARDGD